MSVGERKLGALEVNVAPGTAVLGVLGALRRAVLVGDASVAGFGSLVREARLVGEAGPDFVGEAGLTGGAAGSFLPANDGGHGTVWVQRRVLSWRFSLSRAVFWQNRPTNNQLDIYTPLKF